ncbi:hypothetical protein IWW48_001576 [Coemansia sp. RSA 1200]|nr:hypothetical protein IWW48_001576 [Coemansia sp. RSA 1200]
MVNIKSFVTFVLAISTTAIAAEGAGARNQDATAINAAVAPNAQVAPPAAAYSVAPASVAFAAPTPVFNPAVNTPSNPFPVAKDISAHARPLSQTRSDVAQPNARNGAIQKTTNTQPKQVARQKGKNPAAANSAAAAHAANASAASASAALFQHAATRAAVALAAAKDMAVGMDMAVDTAVDTVQHMETTGTVATMEAATIAAALAPMSATTMNAVDPAAGSVAITNAATPSPAAMSAATTSAATVNAAARVVMRDMDTDKRLLYISFNYPISLPATF